MSLEQNKAELNQRLRYCTNELTAVLTGIDSTSRLGSAESLKKLRREIELCEYDLRVLHQEENLPPWEDQ